MNPFAIVIKLAPIDWKNVRRDSLLMWVPLLPLYLALVIRWGVPALSGFLSRTVAFDLEPWYFLITGGFVISVASTIGTVVGFLLLDERDDGVLDALLVTPISAPAYVAYRVSMPLVAGVLATVVCYPICGIAPLPWVDLVAAATLGGFTAPFTALYLASFADNKVTGFAMAKLIGNVQILPAIGYFLPMPWQLLVGLFPWYWPMKIVWLAADGQPWAPYFVAGLGVNLVAVGLLLRRFDRFVHR